MPQEKQSFILYADAREHTGMMTDNQLGHLFRLLMDFAADGTAPTVAEIGDGMVAMAFSFLSAQIARDKKKYQETCEKRREAGRKGAEVTNRLHQAARAAEEAAKAANAAKWAAKSAEHDHDPEPEPDPHPHHDPEPDPESEPEHDPHPDPLPVPGAAAAPAAEPAGDGTKRTTTGEKMTGETAGDGMKKRTMTPEFFPGDRTRERTADRAGGQRGNPPAIWPRPEKLPEDKPLSDLGSCLPVLDGAPDTPEALWVRLGLGEGALTALSQLLAESRAKGIEEGVLAEVIRRTAEHQPKAPLAYLRSSLEQCAARGCRTLAQFLAAYSGSGRGLRVDRAAPSGNNFLADAAFRTGQIRKKRRDAAPEPVYELLT